MSVRICPSFQNQEEISNFIKKQRKMEPRSRIIAGKSMYTARNHVYISIKAMCERKEENIPSIGGGARRGRSWPGCRRHRWMSGPRYRRTPRRIAGSTVSAIGAPSYRPTAGKMTPSPLNLGRPISIRRSSHIPDNNSKKRDRGGGRGDRVSFI